MAKTSFESRARKTTRMKNADSIAIILGLSLALLIRLNVIHQVKF